MANSTMVIETVFTEGVAHLSYLIGDRATGKAAVIDPRRDVDVYIELANQHKLSITHVLETHNDADLREVQQQLLRVGYTEFRGYLLGGMEQWDNEALPVIKLDQMSVQELNEALPPGDLQIVDVRSPDEWQDGHVPSATYLFLPELEKKAKRLDKKKPVAVYCDSGYRASLAASILQRDGFTEVHNIPGSWKAWRAAEYAIEMPKDQKKASETDR